MAEVATTGKRVLHTLGAMPLSFGVYAVVMWIVTNLGYLMYSILTVIRPGIIEFMASMAGTAVGIMASKAACDTWLPQYHRRTVFVMYAVLLSISAMAYLFILPYDSSDIPEYGQVILTAYLASHVYWNEAEI